MKCTHQNSAQALFFFFLRDAQALLRSNLFAVFFFFLPLGQGTSKKPKAKGQKKKKKKGKRVSNKWVFVGSIDKG
jgi:hypothetical protein